MRGRLPTAMSAEGLPPHVCDTPGQAVRVLDLLRVAGWDVEILTARDGFGASAERDGRHAVARGVTLPEVVGELLLEAMRA